MYQNYKYVLLIVLVQNNNTIVWFNGTIKKQNYRIYNETITIVGTMKNQTSPTEGRSRGCHRQNDSYTQSPSGFMKKIQSLNYYVSMCLNKKNIEC